MQLDDLHKPIENMSDEELRLRLIDVRRRRETVKVVKPRTARIAKTAKKSAIEKFTREQIIAQLSLLEPAK